MEQCWVVRDCTPGDLDEVLEVEAASFADPWERGTFEAELANPGSWFLVLEREGGGVGGFLVAWVVGDEMEIHDVAVAPVLRGRGLGTALMDEVLLRARDAGVRRVFLEVRVGNRPALAMYRGLGFRRVGVRRRYYRDQEDAYTMALEFDRPESPAGRP